MLKVLLRVRTTAESARERAPWLTEHGLKALRKAGHKIPRSQIGELLKLTDAERNAQFRRPTATRCATCAMPCTARSNC